MRLLFLLSGILMLAGCNSVQTPSANCTINGQDCWKVASLLDQTKRIPIEPSNSAQATRQPTAQYKNPELTALGIKVVSGDLIQDGGSTIYMLEGGVYIHTNRSMSANNSQYGFVTILFPDGPKYVFNSSGKLVEFAPEHE